MLAVDLEKMNLRESIEFGNREVQTIWAREKAGDEDREAGMETVNLRWESEAKSKKQSVI